MLCISSSVLADEMRPKIGLVLSGGGAKGAAHIGVLKILEENRIPVDYIAGTSIGAYVAGMYALGYSATEIEKIMLNETWSDGYSDIIPRQDLAFRDKQQRDRFNLPISMGYSDDEVKMPNGLLRGQTMSQLLQRSTGLVNQFGDFDDLAIPYRAVATDLETSKAVVIARGSIVRAMQASATVPGALQPVEYEGKLLIDGGIGNNMPVDVVKALGADIIIAVDIGSSLVTKDKLDSTVAVLNQLSTMLTNASTERQKLLLTDDDILIRPDVGDMSTTDFSIMPQAFLLGKQAALEHLISLQGLSVDKQQFDAYLARKKQLSRNWIDDISHPIVSIVFNNESKVSESLLRETLGIEEGEVVTQEQLAQGIAAVYSLDKFERVNAEFIDTAAGRILTLNTHAKSWGPNYFQFGFSWEDDFSLNSAVSFDVAYTLTDLTDTGGEWRNELRLGYDKLLSTEFYQPLDYDQAFYTRAKLSYEIKDWEIYDTNAIVRELEQKQFNADIGIGYNYVKEGKVEFGFVGETGHLKNELSNDLEYHSYGGYFKFAYDDLNSINLSTSGNRLTLNIYYRKEDNPTNLIFELDESGNSLQIELDWRGALSMGHHSIVGIASLATVNKNEGFSAHLSELGGFLNLSGYHKNSLVGPHKVFGAFVYQYDLSSDVLGMTEFPLYLGTSIEAGNVWELADNVDLNDLIYSSSLYLGTNTKMGPAAIGFGWAEGGVTSIFLFIGKNW